MKCRQKKKVNKLSVNQSVKQRLQHAERQDIGYSLSELCSTPDTKSSRTHVI